MKSSSTLMLFVVFDNLLAMAAAGNNSQPFESSLLMVSLMTFKTPSA
jgi:hypothetical protein